MNRANAQAPSGPTPRDNAAAADDDPLQLLIQRMTAQDLPLPRVDLTHKTGYRTMFGQLGWLVTRNPSDLPAQILSRRQAMLLY